MFGRRVLVACWCEGDFATVIDQAGSAVPTGRRKNPRRPAWENERRLKIKDNGIYGGEYRCMEISNFPYSAFKSPLIVSESGVKNFVIGGVCINSSALLFGKNADQNSAGDGRCATPAHLGFAECRRDSVSGSRHGP